MGYSARYHAFSIIAIFAALLVGLVIGAGLGSDFVSGTTQSLEESLQEDVDEARQSEDELNALLETERQFGAEVYPDLVAGRLDGDRVGLVSLGALPDELAENVDAALTPTGAQVSRVAVVRLPPDLEQIADTSLGRLAQKPGGLTEAGRRLGRQLAGGGKLLSEGREALLERFSGEGGKVNRLVLMRTATSGLEPTEQQAVNEFESGILEGIRDSGVTAVAVERTDTEPSSVELFDAEQIPTVDSVDLNSGKVALVFALLGADGNYGIKETADSLLPELVLGLPKQESQVDDGGRAHPR